MVASKRADCNQDPNEPLFSPLAPLLAPEHPDGSARLEIESRARANFPGMRRVYRRPNIAGEQASLGHLGRAALPRANAKHRPRTECQPP